MTNRPEAYGMLTPSLQQRSVLWLFKGTLSLMCTENKWESNSGLLAQKVTH